ncbi:LOW QUALITY PROTEIN: probable 3',5'-cyclic phosphodiesterase pde-5 [Pollicipes pollicipes]|uniref:LOW QUALITY PROTEIN: probable 3',5'-cyclic phosphodiesterase pde-5 n=1 Tax=Pollicipes pollicipes TaxID=41117 RepID=UPI0018851F37|nr:LOW QUALITY PROTEIN: probable 3',5'-cyclic phosphodiesterase pde-5 [Pollicipes pollicipes]
MGVCFTRVRKDLVSPTPSVNCDVRMPEPIRSQPSPASLPGFSTHGAQSNNRTASSSCNDRTEPPPWERLTATLRERPDLLEKFVMEHVELDQLERWIIRKTQRTKNSQGVTKAAVHSPSVVGAPSQNSSASRKTSLSRWKQKTETDALLSPQFCVHADKRKMLEELTRALPDKPGMANVLTELAGCIASAVNADFQRLYLVEKRDGHVHSYDPETQQVTNTYPIGPGTVLAAHVAATRQPLRISVPFVDPDKYPEGVGGSTEGAEHVMAQPVHLSDGDLVAVMELYRSGPHPFYEEDEEIVNSYIVWGGIALHYADLYHTLSDQRKVHDFILDVTKSIFQDMVSMDTLITKIMNFAQRLVAADRASLFLMDGRTRELYARIFDMGNANGDSSPQAQEIRFAVGTGIAGQVALNAQGLNIVDAYADDRFNRSIDQQTGYVTRSLLCMPIFSRGVVIGVVQMVNKTAGAYFTKADEENFEFFAVYCGLALHHAKLYDKIRRSEQKYKVALEVLSYHNSSTDSEVAEYKGTFNMSPSAGLNDYNYNVFETSETDKIRDAVFMFTDLFGTSRFDIDCLIRFTITVKKNYRRVPYHNWTHGFAVANMIYCIIKHNPDVFKTIESLSLYVGSLCHDLDHRGRNNKFMLDTDSAIAAIYSTSTMEHHHFNQTVTILQQEGHNILGKLSSSEYKQALSNIKHCILATDLALFFPNKAKLAGILKEGLFDWGNSEHRLLLQAISMTACDLCASSKPWKIQIQTVADIFEEFYEQGDAEKQAGRTPLQLMDRSQHDQQAHSQVGFLTGICIPCYDLLYQLIPETQLLVAGCKNNLARWMDMAEAGGWQEELSAANSNTRSRQSAQLAEAELSEDS